MQLSDSWVNPSSCWRQFDADKKAKKNKQISEGRAENCVLAELAACSMDVNTGQSLCSGPDWNILKTTGWIVVNLVETFPSGWTLILWLFIQQQVNFLIWSILTYQVQYLRSTLCKCSVTHCEARSTHMGFNAPETEIFLAQIQNPVQI